MNKKPLCGIDEAGRGPLAGSLVIAGVVLKNPVEGLMDSAINSCKSSGRTRRALPIATVRIFPCCINL